MLTPTLHLLSPALLAFAALAGLLLAPAGASANCGAMMSAGACPPSKAACCCCKAPAVADVPVRARPELVEPARTPHPLACPSTANCPCVGQPEGPAESAPRSARVVEDGRPDRVGISRVELPDLRPSPCPAGPRPAPASGPPHVPLYLRNARFLI